MAGSPGSFPAGDLGPPPPGEAGQSSVELALVLPALFLLLMALLQGAVIARDHVLLVHAAREAVREAAVTDDKAAPRRAAIARSRLDPDLLTVEVTGQRRGSRKVSAELSYEVPTRIPIVGSLVPDVTLRAKASMRREGL